jgi:hypothetical protein
MILLGATTVAITHRPGGYVDGEWVQGTPSVTSGSLSVQVLTARELEKLPELQRTRASFKAYSATELQTVQMSDPHQCDLVAWHGRNYEVHGVEDWTAHTGGLVHYKYLLVEVGEDESQYPPGPVPPGPTPDLYATQSWVLAQIAMLRPHSVSLYPVPASGLLNGDPTTGSIDADGEATGTDEVVLHAFVVDSVDVQILGIRTILLWGTTVDGGTGSTRWLISTGTEEVGEAPSDDAEPISAWYPAPTVATQQHTSGRVDDDVLPPGSFTLLLSGKVDALGATLSATISKELLLKVTF